MRRLISVRSQKCPKTDPSKSEIPKKPKLLENVFYKSTLVMQ